jgi:hypothetical protein
MPNNILQHPALYIEPPDTPEEITRKMDLLNKLPPEVTADNVEQILQELRENPNTAYEKAMRLNWRNSPYIEFLSDNLRILTFGDSKIAVLNKPEHLFSNAVLSFRQKCLLRETITEIILKNTIHNLPEGCFANMPKLHTVHIPTPVTYVDDNAFDGCDTLLEKAKELGFDNVGDYLRPKIPRYLEPPWFSDGPGTPYPYACISLPETPYLVTEERVIFDQDEILEELLRVGTNVRVGNRISTIPAEIDQAVTLTLKFIKDLSGIKFT